MIEVKKFPYSDYEVTLIDREEILKTIDNNILDKDVAIELINSLEVKAESYIKRGKWTSIPYFGSIRVPEGLKPEVKKEFNKAKQFAFEHLPKKEYVAFIKEIVSDNKERIKYNSFFNQILAMAVRKDKRKWTNLCRNYNDNYASCKMVFGYLVKPMKEDYEYIIEHEQEVLEWEEKQYGKA